MVNKKNSRIFAIEIKTNNIMNKSICTPVSYLFYYNDEKISLKRRYDIQTDREFLDCFINDEFIMEIFQSLPDEVNGIFEDQIIEVIQVETTFL